MPELPSVTASENGLVALNMVAPDRLPQSEGPLSVSKANAELCMDAIREAHCGLGDHMELEDSVVRSLANIEADAR